MVPNPKTLKYDVISQLEEPGEDPTHLFLWDEISHMLAKRFKANQGLISDAYTGIPRGRIIAPYDRTGKWIVAHGNDTDLIQYGSEIVSAFSLSSIQQTGRLSWEVDPHEKMSPHERSQVESACRFKLTKSGIIIPGK